MSYKKSFYFISCVMFFGGAATLWAFTGPTANPPGNNVRPPINQTDIRQDKSTIGGGGGELGVKNLFLGAGSPLEGDIYDIDELIGVNDLRLRGSPGNANPIFIEGNPVVINNDPPNASVGIGVVPNPAFKLDVGGVTRLGSLGADPAPASSAPGAIYYNVALGKFRCYQGAAWVDCGTGSGGGGLTGTGLAGQVTFWNSATSLAGNSDLFWNNTTERLGIGTVAPGAKLDVRGTIMTGAAAGVSTSIEVGQQSSGNHFSYIDFHGDDTYTDFGLRLIRGNTGPDALSQLVHRGIGDLYILATEAARIRLRTTNLDRMVIEADGDVGIGDPTPAYKLDVGGGDINTTGVYRVGGIAGIGATCPAGQTASGITMAGGIVTAAGVCTPIGGGGGLTGGGTINFLSKFTGASVLGNSQVFDDGSNVGIGTPAPTRKLEVSGAVTGIKVTDTDPTGNAFIELSTNDGGLSLFQNVGGRTRIFIGGERMTFLNTGNVGIGDPTPTYKLDVAGDINTSGIYRVGGVAGIGASCPVGETPSGITTIGGIVTAAGVCTPIGGGGGGLTGTGLAGQVTFWNSATNLVGDSNLFWDTANNRLGIGDATPLAALTVGAGDDFQVTSAGLVRAPNGSFTTPSYSFVGDPNTGIYSGGANILRLVTAGTDRMTIDAAGRVGIGNATPAYRLDVTGNARITTGLDVGSQRITSVATPIAGTDGVNKDYVDAQLGVHYIVTTRKSFYGSAGWGSCSLGNPGPFCPSGWISEANWVVRCNTESLGDLWEVQTLCRK